MPEPRGLRLHHHWIADLLGSCDSFFSRRREQAFGERQAERGEQRLGLIFWDHACEIAQAGNRNRRARTVGQVALGEVCQPRNRAVSAFGGREPRDASIAQAFDIFGRNGRAFVNPGKHQRLARIACIQHRLNRGELDLGSDRIGLDDAGHHAADALIFEQHFQQVGVDHRFGKADGGDVGRVGNGHEIGQHSADFRAVLVVQIEQVEADIVSQIECQPA